MIRTLNSARSVRVLSESLLLCIDALQSFLYTYLARLRTFLTRTCPRFEFGMVILRYVAFSFNYTIRALYCVLFECM
ncbi:hypothetical protein R3P38DRAFT_3038197 [Favolaschia claudopus]|uniref:Uncharacterized protein n=1 Tax=Favolaschia claudopus TaxID=2862362 RepID=A0AAW0ABA4_9AGAR